MLVIAGVVLAIVGLSLDSSIVYTVWVDGRALHPALKPQVQEVQDSLSEKLNVCCAGIVGDGTLYYAQQVDTLDVLMLCIAFCGAAIIAVFSYALFSLMVGKREGKLVVNSMALRR